MYMNVPYNQLTYSNVYVNKIVDILNSYSERVSVSIASMPAPTCSVEYEPPYISGALRPMYEYQTSVTYDFGKAEFYVAIKNGRSIKYPGQKLWIEDADFAVTVDLNELVDQMKDNFNIEVFAALIYEKLDEHVMRTYHSSLYEL